MKKQEYAEKYGRWIEDNEIVIEDLSEKKLLSVMDEMGKKGYNLEYWKAHGQKSGHLHIKNIPHLEELDKYSLAKYKELIIKKYVQDYVNSEVDLQLCHRHRIVKENQIHYKYKTPKLLIKTINPDNKNFCEKDLFLQAKNKSIEEKKERVINTNGSGITAKIVKRVSIIDLARKYGFKVKGNKAVCRFHADKDPSLSFDDSRGYFFCFGCRKQGNIVDFLALCKQYNLKKEEVKSNETNSN